MTGGRRLFTVPLVRRNVTPMHTSTSRPSGPAEATKPAPTTIERCPPLLVAITGGSASGKSTLAHKLTARLAHLQPMIVPQDQYFREWGPDEQPARTTNSPPAVRWETLREHLRLWCAGAAAGPPPRQRGAGQARRAGNLILLDGHLILWDEAIRAMCDLRIYLDVPDEERVMRRLLRDVSNHEFDLERAVAWYRRDVLPNFWRYTAPARWWCDLVLPADPVSAAAEDALCAAIDAAWAARRAAGKKTMLPNTAPRGPQ